MNNMALTSSRIAQPYPVTGQIAGPYDQQRPVKDLNKYATLKAVEKANDSFYGNRRPAIEMTTKGGLPVEAVDMEPEPCNPYNSPPRQLSTKQNGHKHQSPLTNSSQSHLHGSNTAAGPGMLRSWDSDDMLGLHRGHGPNKLCIVGKEVRTTHHVPSSQPYFVTNSKTEVTV